MNTVEPTDSFGGNKKPEIDYPCRWLYKVIGKHPESIREAIIASCGPTPVDITLSHSSSQGTYCSFNAELTVDNEDMRLAIYRSLTNHPAVKLVL